MTMPSNINPLRIRKMLGRQPWGPPQPFGPDAWIFVRAEHTGSVIVTCAEHELTDWVHASIAYPTHMPTYEDLKMLHRAVFGRGWAYQVFAPPSEHVNIHDYALHLFGRLDGSPALPDFTDGTGSI